MAMRPLYIQTEKQNKKPNTRLYIFVGAMGLFMCIVFGIAAWTAVNNPVFASILRPTVPPAPEYLWSQVEIVKPLPWNENQLMASTVETAVPTEEAQPIPALESTLPPTDLPSTSTEEPTFTPEPSETPGQLSMEIVPNTPTSVYVPPPTSPAPKPSVASSGNGVRWIDVDLTNQRVYAYEGDTVVNSFLVSTGTWLTPTVTGQYKIYVKYLSAKMSGPGYYLPNVPYVMYFYGSYGLHGTYWHNNFGTPMSHGCVNLRTEDAHWLYDWSSVGTVVNVHY